MKSERRTLTIKFILAILLMIIAKMIFVDRTIAWLGKAAPPIFITLLTIYFLEPLVQRFQSLKLLKNNRVVSVVLSFVTVILILAGFIAIIIPSIADSINSIIDVMPNSVSSIVNMIMSIPFVDVFIEAEDITSILANFGDIFMKFRDSILTYSTNILLSFKDAVLAIGVFLLALMMSFYALRDYEQIRENLEIQLRSLFGDSFSDSFMKVFNMTDHAMKKFLVGKLNTCFFLGLMVAVFGLIFNIISPKDIPYLPLIAFIIGITNMIPYIGPIFGTIPAILFTMINGFIPTVAVIIIILGSQQIDNILISPKIIGDSVGLKPFWVIFSVTIGGRLFGIIGMLLTVPITSVILMLLDERKENYLKKKAKASALHSIDTTQN